MWNPLGVSAAVLGLSEDILPLPQHLHPPHRSRYESPFQANPGGLLFENNRKPNFILDREDGEQHRYLQKIKKLKHEKLDRDRY